MSADVLDAIVEEAQRASLERREPFAISLTLEEAVDVLDRLGAGWIGLPTLISGVRVQVAEFCRHCQRVGRAPRLAGLLQVVEGVEDGAVYCSGCGVGRDPQGYYSRAAGGAYGTRLEL